MSISISRPRPSSGVSWTFTVDGVYDLSSLLLPQTPLGTIVVTVYESDGTTALPNTTIVPSVIDIPSGAPSGKWSVSVTHDANYNGAVIVAVLTPAGGTGQSYSVQGIDISQ